MKKSIRVFVILCIIAALPGLFQGFNQGFGSKHLFGLISLASASDSCGAYVAPGVWKEFDCYNLAAIGKNTGDDPFTPSWRLIGGYWQWGRKGPDPSQWYDTNTSNFAHGPTGPSSGEANSGSISGWDETDAPDVSWSKGSQAVYYLLDQEADLNKTDTDGDGKVDLLLNLNTNGFRFRVDNGVELSISFDKTLLLSPAEPYQTGKVITHADFVAALQPGLAQLIADGLVPADTILELDNNLKDSTYLDDGSRSSDIPAMVLRTQTDSILKPVGFAWVGDLVGYYNVWGRWSSEAEVSDICPAGFQMPTKSQWQGVVENNVQRTAGSWSESWDDYTNYSSARFFGDNLMLPAAGLRNYVLDGGLFHRGLVGSYWSSTPSSNNEAGQLYFSDTEADVGFSSRQFGFSVRCIAGSENPPPCTYHLSRTNSSFNSGSESHSVSVTTSGSNCSWSTSESLSWVSLSPSSGTGNGTVTISVTPNTGTARSGSITIAGQTYSISQAGAPDQTTLDISVTAEPTSGTVPLDTDFTCTVETGTAPYSFSWHFGDGATSTLQNPSHTYAEPGNYLAQVIVTDSSLTSIDAINIQANAVTQNNIVLTNASPKATIAAGRDTTVYGSAGANSVILESGASAELINFPGFNAVQIQSNSDAFQVSRSGTVVTFEGNDGTVLKIPATTSVQTITFSDKGALTLSLPEGQVMLDDQVITTDWAVISSGDPDVEHELDIYFENAENNEISDFPGEEIGLKVSAVSTLENPQFTYQILSSDLDFPLVDNEGNITAVVPESAEPGSTLSIRIRVSENISQLTEDLTASVYVMQKNLVGSGAVSEQGGTVSDDTNSIRVEVPAGVLDSEAQIDIFKGETEDGRQVISFWTDAQGTDSVKIYLPELSNESRKKTASNKALSRSVQSQIVKNYLHFDWNEYDPKFGESDHSWYIKLGFNPFYFQFNPYNFYYRLPSQKQLWDKSIDIPLDELKKLKTEERQTFRLISAAHEISTLKNDDYIPVLFIHGYKRLGDFSGGHEYWGNFPYLMDQLEINGKKIKSFDFQWRNDSRFQDAAKDLAKTVKELYYLTGDKKIHIIAHSFGGVLARCYLQGIYEDSNWDDPTVIIGSLISFGSPYSGVFDNETDKNGILFPDGQHQDLIKAARNLTVYQMGEETYYGRIKKHLNIDDSPGEIAYQLANTIDRIPSDFPMTIGVSTIATNHYRTDSKEVNYYHFPNIMFMEGDGLISFKGQRFFPTLATSPLLSVEKGNNLVDKHTLNINEIFLGFNDNTVPDSSSLIEIWDVTDLKEEETDSTIKILSALKETLNYKHSQGSLTIGLFKPGDLPGDVFIDNLQNYVECDDIDNCSHESFLLVKEHLEKIFSNMTPPLEVSYNEVALSSGDVMTVSIISGGSGYYTVSSSNPHVATVSLIGNEVTIAGVSDGTAVITVNDTGGGSASIDVTVTSTVTPPGDCGAYIAPGVWKEFDCYNLAAIGKTTGDNPFIPSWSLIGGYWQWGRRGPDPSVWHFTNTPHFAHGPTGPGSSEANEGAISNWDSSHAPDGAWSDSYKTSNDPCPAGYRIPTISQWQGVLNNNAQSTVGTWSTTWDDHTNYSSARYFGDKLLLPAAGSRYYYSGASYGRGRSGFYWSSSESSSSTAWGLYFRSNRAYTSYNDRRRGYSVRCVAE